MDARMFRLENPLFSTLQHLVDLPDEMEKAFNTPSNTYVSDARAMASTPADVKELKSAYEFVLDMPGVKSGEIKVQVEDGNTLTITGKIKDTMDARIFRLENPLFSTLQHLVDLPDEMEIAFNTPSKTYARDARAMASTPADVKELTSAYEFVLDMPGVKSGEIKVQVEDGNTLTITGERRRDDEDKESGGKYLRMERRVGKFMRKFSLPDNANLEAISAVCRDGVLTVTVQKLPPPQPKKPKTIEVEDGNTLTITGERRRDDEDKESGGKYVRMERRVGKFMRKFSLPDNANLEAISAVCRDGVLTVTVQKLPPPQPKKPKTIEVKIA
ncbi:hypothetical protein M5K25_004842 [Dendrobium thyrsiflorum]|uniref:SHSP domain-containing protein n=1 Tax=Dendrobium thyrsiflorum TaxID=117978 RepID=A0ABD0VGC9_DENTH